MEVPPPPPPEINRQKNVKLSTFMIVSVALAIVCGFAAVAILQVNNLQQQNTLLSELYAESQNDYTALQNQYGSLQTQYNNAQANYNTLNSKYSQMVSSYGTLCDDIDDFREMLFSYIDLTASFSRTLSSAAISATASAVASCNGGSLWPSTQNIYNYIVSNIEYVNDIDAFYISGSAVRTFDGKDYYSQFSTATIQNYLQTPALTLDLEQGDCDDMAVLAYGMIKYYMKYVSGTEYTLYLGRVELNDGDSHVAVFMPVTGGKLCVIDPAGKYLTRSWGTISSYAASTELQSYSSHWSSHAGIDEITLYRVNVIDGSYTIFAHGTLSQIAVALS